MRNEGVQQRNRVIHVQKSYADKAMREWKQVVATRNEVIAEQFEVLDVYANVCRREREKNKAIFWY